jgi:hypothetical protein
LKWLVWAFEAGSQEIFPYENGGNGRDLSESCGECRLLKLDEVTKA